MATDGKPLQASSLTTQIATQLGETQPQATMQIKRIVNVLGTERALALVEHAVQIEAQGGMLVPDGSRRRTLGGVFFKLVRDQTTAEEHAQIWPWEQRRSGRASDPAAPPLS